MGTNDRAHDFFQVVDRFYEDEDAKRPTVGYVQTHPLEEVPKGDNHTPIDAWDPTKYDYVPHIQQFDLNDPAGIEGYERVMKDAIEGRVMIRDEKSSTDRDGNFRALVSWMSVTKKEQTKH